MSKTTKDVGNPQCIVKTCHQWEPCYRLEKQHNYCKETFLKKCNLAWNDKL